MEQAVISTSLTDNQRYFYRVKTVEHSFRRDGPYKRRPEPEFKILVDKKVRRIHVKEISVDESVKQRERVFKQVGSEDTAQHEHQDKQHKF
jgi:hypothetical protein